MSLITSGWFSRPVSRRVRARRSTALLAVAFVGLGAVYLQTRPDVLNRTPVPIVIDQTVTTRGPPGTTDTTG